MWHEIWVFALENYIFHTMVIMTVLFLIFGGKINFRRLKRISKDGVEFHDEKDDKTDPHAPCPYIDSKKRSMESIEKNAKQITENTKAIDELAITLKEMMAKIDDFTLDSLKRTFWDKNQPLEDRMFAGLKYVVNGGNSGTKTELIKMMKEYPDIYRIIIRIKPELRLAEIEG